MSIPFKLKRCPHCKAKMEEGRRIHPDCIEGFAQAQAEKSARAQAKRVLMAAKVDKALTKQKLATFKSMGTLIAEAQKEFNTYVRKRDQLAGHACISSGKPLDWSGNGVDAGHYRSRGSAPHLRFDERNVHAQSKQENRYASGNATGYRVGLIARIGRDAVDALECDQTPRKYTKEQLIALKREYATKARALEAAQ